MVYPVDYLPDFQPPGGDNLHTQESGDAGLSSDMVHKFFYKYEESALPVTDTGSCVRPIPHMEQFPMTKSKPHPYPPESQPTPMTEGFVTKSSLAGIQTGLHNNFHCQSYTGREDNSKGEEEVKPLPGTSAITEALMEDVGSNCSIVDANRDACASATPVEEGSNQNSYTKRAVGKKWKVPVYRLCVVAVLIINFPVCNGSYVGPNCFVCKDQDECPNLNIIYNQRDHILYQRNNGGTTFAECSEIPPPVPKTPETCTVCQSQFVFISCSNDTNEIQPEAKGLFIEDIHKTCMQYKTPDPVPSRGTCHNNLGRGPTGLVCMDVLFLIVVGALMIF